MQNIFGTFDVVPFKQELDKLNDVFDRSLDCIKHPFHCSDHCLNRINGLYYVIDRSPIHIKTNLMGSITIIESTGTLNGTTFTLSTGSGCNCDGSNSNGCINLRRRNLVIAFTKTTHRCRNRF